MSNIFEDLMKNFLVKTLRNAINCWLIHDDKYFDFIDSKCKYSPIIEEYDLNDNEELNQMNQKNGEEFDAIVHHHNAPHHPRNISSSAAGNPKSMFDSLFCCNCKLDLKMGTIQMSPVLLYELNPNEHFENLNIAIDHLRNDFDYALASNSDTMKHTITCSKLRTDCGEYWYIRNNHECLIMFMQMEENKNYPIDVHEFVDRNEQQIIDLFNLNACCT